MLVDCPYWVKHGDNDGIAGLDVCPNGRRLATCGTDPQVVIWNMLPILDEAAEQDAAVPKVLAILNEHASGNAVLTLRFSHSGAFLATGSTDRGVLVFRRLATAAGPQQLLGGGQKRFANIENWRPVGSLRLHSLDVTALSWSVGDEYLASGSMDGNVIIWAISKEGKGTALRTLEAPHYGWVKGLAFDPIGRYLATQGRNGVKVWDMQRDWVCVTHQKKPFERAPDAGFRYRISWSPDGEVLLAANGAENKHLTICAFTRQTWEMDSMVGHTGAVLVTAANPRLFYPPLKLQQQRLNEGQEDRGDEHLLPLLLSPGGSSREGAAAGPTAAAAAAGGQAGGGGQQQQQQGQFSEEASMVFAAGSNDKSVSIWSSNLQRPLLHITQVHGAGICDMAWTPDGYTLIAASLDDRVCVTRFARSELGRALSNDELQQLIQAEYGAAAAPPAAAAAAEAQQQANGPAAAAAAAGGILTQEEAQLAALAQLGDADNTPAAAAAAGDAFPTPTRDPHPALGDGPAPAPAAAAAAGGAGGTAGGSTGGLGSAAAPLPAPVRKSAAAAAAAAPGGAGPSGGALDKRLMPQGTGITAGTLTQQQQQQRQQVGQKRQHPAAAAAAAGGGGGALHPAKRAHIGPGPQQQQQAVAGRAAAGGAAAGAAAAGGSGRGGWLLPPPPTKPRLELQITVLSVPQQQQQQQQYQSVTLLVENRRGGGSSGSNGGGSGGGRAGWAEVSLQLGGNPGCVLWSDRVPEQVVAVAGSICFTAAVGASGLLYTWRSRGSPLLPPVALGCPPASLTAQGDWQLVVVGADGAILTLDLNQKRRQLSGPIPQPNLAPVLAAAPPGTALQDTWITAAGSSGGSSGSNGGSSAQPPIGPTLMAVLTDSSAWLFHPDMGLWVRVRPVQPAAAAAAVGVQAGVAAAAAAAAAAGGSGGGDVEKLRASAGQQEFLPRLQQARADAAGDVISQRQEAYEALTTAWLLGDPRGYQATLKSLVLLLARDRQTERLVELCQDLLGPETWEPQMAAAAAGGGGGGCGWAPSLLGLDKRTLLAQLVVPVMAREKLPLAAQVHACLERANKHAREAAARAAAAAAQAAAAGLGTPLGATAAAAAAAGFGGGADAGLRLQRPQPSPAAAAGGGGGAAAATAAAAANGYTQQETDHRQQSGGVVGETGGPGELYAQQQQQQRQQADGDSGVGGLSGGARTRHSIRQKYQQGYPGDHQQQQQQQDGAVDGLAAAAAAGANGVAHGTGTPAAAAHTTPRRLQPVPVDSQQQQQQQLEPRTGSDGAARIPLQEQQQQQQHRHGSQPPAGQQQQAGKQQQQQAHAAADQAAM